MGARNTGFRLIYGGILDNTQEVIGIDPDKLGRTASQMYFDNE